MALFGESGSNEFQSDQIDSKVSAPKEKLDYIDATDTKAFAGQEKRQEKFDATEKDHQADLAIAEGEGMNSEIENAYPPDYDTWVTKGGVDKEAFAKAMKKRMKGMSLEEKHNFLEEQIAYQPELIQKQKDKLAALKKTDKKAALKFKKIPGIYPEFETELMNMQRILIEEENKTEKEENKTEKEENKTEKEENKTEKEENIILKKDKIQVENTEDNLKVLQKQLEDEWNEISSSERANKVSGLLKSYEDMDIKDDHIQTMITALHKFNDALQLPPETSQEDKARVATLFNNLDNVSLDKEGITSFCTAIQDDTELSVETKTHVLKKLGVSMTITSGKQLNKALETTATEIDPNTGEEIQVPVHTKKNPLKMQGGVEAYVNEKGEKIMILPGNDKMEIRMRTMNAQEDNSAREQLRIGMALNAMPEEMVSVLFPEHQIGERNVLYHDKTIHRMNRFMQALLPKETGQVPDRIPTETDIAYFKDALNAITHEKSMGRIEMMRDLEATGVLEGGVGSIDFNTLEAIGNHLRANDYNQNLSFAYGGDAGFDDIVTRFGPKDKKEVEEKAKDESKEKKKGFWEKGIEKLRGKK